MPPESLQHRLARWHIDELLAKYSGLRLQSTLHGSVEIAGTLLFVATMAGLETIQDEYEIQLHVPESFPKWIPTVYEIAGRIPQNFHKLDSGALCLGSPTRLRLALTRRPTILGYVDTCLVPYLYGRSYFERYATMPFGELDHGLKGVRQDLALLFGTIRVDRVSGFARLTAMKKRHANKKACPCESGKRLGRCHHHRRVNELREQLGRGWFGHIAKHADNQ